MRSGGEVNSDTLTSYSMSSLPKYEFDKNNICSFLIFWMSLPCISDLYYSLSAKKILQALGLGTSHYKYFHIFLPFTLIMACQYIF